MWFNPYKRIRELEDRLEKEHERNRQREDTLLNRVLTSRGVYPILPEHLEEPKASVPIEPDSVPGMVELRQQFDEWAEQANVPEDQRQFQWDAYKKTYAEQILE